MAVSTSLTKAPSRALALKQAAMDSFRLYDSTKSLDLEKSTMTGDEQQHFQQLTQCIEAHNLREHSNERLFQVKRFTPRGREKKKQAEHDGKICIACTRPECSHKIFLLETGLEDTPEGWALEEARIMEELLQHETKHYVTFAKIVLWLLEAMMVMIFNYYDV